MKTIIFFLSVALWCGFSFSVPTGSSPQGCLNSVLKTGYTEHLSALQLAGAVAIYQLQKSGPHGDVTSTEAQQRLATLIDVNFPETTSKILGSVFNPLTYKGLTSVGHWGRNLCLTLNGSGVEVVRNNFAAFAAVYSRRMDESGYKTMTLEQLHTQRFRLYEVPRISLADYLILLAFDTSGSVALTTNDVYTEIVDSLSYYREWLPQNPTLILQKLRRLSQLGYLQVAERGGMGTAYRFKRSAQFKDKVKLFEFYYLSLLKNWLKNDKTKHMVKLLNSAGLN